MYKRTKIKTILLGSLAVLSVVGLTSCKKTSTKSIGAKDIYAQATYGGKTYTVTKGELWEELKWEASDAINEHMTKYLMGECIAEIEEALNGIKGTSSISTHMQKLIFDYLEEQAFIGIYATTNMEKLKKNEIKSVTKSVQTYIDTAYVAEGKEYTLNEFMNYENLENNAITLFAGTNLETKYYLYNYYENFKYSGAQKLYAYYQKVDDIAKHDKNKSSDEDPYYTDKEIIQYHSEHYQWSADSQAIMIRFNNEDEINSTLKAFGIKAYNDTFYFIPQNGKTNTEYNEYYDDFKINAASDSEKCFNLSTIGGETAVFELYVQMYNYIYAYRDSLPVEPGVISSAFTSSNCRDVTESIVVKYVNMADEDYKDASDIISSWANDVKESITYTQDGLDDIDTNLKFYINKELRTIPVYSEGEARYSTSGKNYNNFYYMAFKIDQGEIDSYYELLNDPYEDTVINGHEDLVAELKEEMMWDEVDQTAINLAVRAATEKTKAYIYDSGLEILYSTGVSSYSKTHKNAPKSNVAITLKYSGKNSHTSKKAYNITIDELFEQLEKGSGVTKAVDMLSKKAIKDTPEYNDTKDDIKDYKNTLDLLLAYFANGSLSEYDSSIGKYNFLMLYFHTADVDKIVANYYRVNAASAKILTNYANNTAFYEMVQSYAKLAYNQDFTASASRLTVYVDMDEDGKEDKDFDWNTQVPTSSAPITYSELALKLIRYTLTRMKNEANQLSTLESIVDEYKNSQRFTNGIDEYTGPGMDDYDPTQPETIWAEYKRAGLYMSINTHDAVSNELTDTDNAMYVKEKVKDLYNSISMKDLYPSEYVDFEPYAAGNDGWKTEKGYELLVISSATVRNTAKFEEKDDIAGIYTNIFVRYEDDTAVIGNIYNDLKDEATLDQIQLFIYEYLNYNTSTLFPSSIQDYITSYIMPVYTKYTGTQTQLELLLNKLLSNSVQFIDNPENNARLEKIRKVNQRISDEYVNYAEYIDGYTQDEYFDFPNWWIEILK